MQYRITTSPGLEDLAATEIHLALGAAGLTGDVTEKPFGLAGNLLLRIPAASVPDPELHADLTAVLHELKLAFHVVQHVHETLLPGSPDLASLCDAVADVSLPGCGPTQSFRVSSVRQGMHGFTSLDIEREAGSVVQKATGMSVDLENFDMHVRVDLLDSRLLVGLQTTRRGLDKRYTWVYKPRVSLKTVVARGLLELASQGLDGVSRIVDPFCGSGTILLEAADMFPQASIAGSDLFEKVVEGARANIVAAGLSERVTVRQADARDLRRELPAASVDMIVSNPPFGVRLGPRTDFKRLYHQFLAGASHVLRPGGQLVFLGGRRRHHVVHVLREVRSLSLKHVRVIETGGIYPAVYVMTRLP